MYYYDVSSSDNYTNFKFPLGFMYMASVLEKNGFEVKKSVNALIVSHFCSITVECVGSLAPIDCENPKSLDQNVVQKTKGLSPSLVVEGVF